MRVSAHEAFQLLGERGMSRGSAAWGACRQFDLAEVGVLFENVDGAELIEIEAGWESSDA
jgi:hypothetical protein